MDLWYFSFRNVSFSSFFSFYSSDSIDPLPCVSSCKGTNPIYEGSWPMVSQRPRLLTLSHWGLGLQQENFRGTQACSPLAQMLVQGQVKLQCRPDTGLGQSVGGLELGAYGVVPSWADKAGPRSWCQCTLEGAMSEPVPFR